MGKDLEPSPSHALHILDTPLPLSWPTLGSLGLHSCHSVGKAGTGSLTQGGGQSLLWHLSVGHPMSGLLGAIKTIWSNTKTGEQIGQSLI